MMNMKTNTIVSDAQLFDDIAKGGKIAEGAMNALVNRHLGLVHKVANQFARKFPGIDKADLLSDGNIALMNAIRGFDRTRGYAFSTYAWQALTNSAIALANAATKRRKAFGATYDPSLPSIAERTSHRAEKEEAVQKSLIHDLAVILAENKAGLTAIEMTIIEQRFGLYGQPMKLEDIGNAMNLSKERIRQHQVKALAKLRGVLEVSL
jgi:RNA polymerase sigma factor (sigma-70 family)